MPTKIKSFEFSSLAIWLGRLGGLASVVLLALFVIGSIQSGDPMPTIREAIGIGFFPVGVVIGLLLGWRRPVLGGSISLGSLIGFYAWSYVVAGRLDVGPYFMIFTLPAVFYLIGGLSAKAESRVDAK